jgi:hypothetical protein
MDARTDLVHPSRRIAKSDAPQDEVFETHRESGAPRDQVFETHR